ncbi:MAG TPA: DUF5686 family protein [Chitinophagaceae bacterium]|nr:DUF5686 family protein [Chitinophagaceae bacterium]
MNCRYSLFCITVALFCIVCSTPLNAQNTVVNGTVTDAVTKKPIPYAAVFFKEGRGRNADSLGHFSLTAYESYSKIVVSFVGYKTQTIDIMAGATQDVDVQLQPLGNHLGEVVISNKSHARYRNKNNPAVELIRKVIENKDKNRTTHYSYMQYHQYEKLAVYINNIPKSLSEGKTLQKYQFLFANPDTVKIPGKSLNPVYLEETVTNNYYRQDPEAKKTFVLGRKQVNYGEYIDNNGISEYLNNLYQDVDIYSNNIPLFTYQFLSPIADLGPQFYQYFLRDTVTDEDGVQLARLYFNPRNTGGLLFKGTMFITLDGNYAVQKINMFVSRQINLNFIKEMHIDLSFVKNSEDGHYMLVKSVVNADATVSNKRKNGGFFGERTVTLSNLQVNKPIDDSVFAGPDVVMMPGADQKTDNYWTIARQPALTLSESKVYGNIDSLAKMPSFRHTVDMVSLLTTGYKSYPYFEIGPVPTFIGYNPVEGTRVRLGGRTTAKLSSRLYFETYGAYGFKDDKFKYFLSSTYSISNQSIYKFPNHFIQASIQRDTKIPGQELEFITEDNFLLSFKRGVNDKWLYNDVYKVNYVQEFNNHFSYTLGFKYWLQKPAGSITYVKYAMDTVRSLATTELSAEFRWAPNEQFYQSKVYRVPIVNKYPIFTLRFIAGIKGLFGSQYTYQKIEGRVEKRINLSLFGYVDAFAEGGYIFGKLPYPLLMVHRANQSYAFQLNSYSLMNFLEFVSDHYAAATLDYHLNGLLFNRVPLLKKLKLREVASLKVLFGGVRDNNNPSLNPSLYKLPAGQTFTLNNGPYVEGSVGVTNIFKFFRVDLIKRFTYLNHPNLSTLGVRVRLKFDF